MVSEIKTGISYIQDMHITPSYTSPPDPEALTTLCLRSGSLLYFLLHYCKTEVFFIYTL